MGKNIAAVTGAWSFSGRHVAQRLLANGWTLRSISNRNPSPGDDPYQGQVRRIGYTHDIDRLATDLSNCRVLVSNFWSRHDKPPIGHRGPWLSHLQAVDQSAVLIEAAARAGVERLVWTSITNPGQDPDLSYFAGKAVVEQLVRRSDLSFAILRPACFFGGGGILLDNVAWAARRLPFVPIPDGPPYRIRPIHVEDYADLVVEAVASSDDYTIDAVGPDRPEFSDLVREVAEAAGGRAKALRLPMKACRLSYAVAGRILGETVLYTLRKPIEVAAKADAGSAARFLKWTVSGDHRWSGWWRRMHGEASNPARTRVGPGLAYRAAFVDGPIFRIDSNVDPVPVNADGRERPTPLAFRADRFSGSTTVTPRLIESQGRGYRHRFRSWSDGGDMTHTVEVPQDADTALTLTLDTEYRLDTRAWRGSRNTIHTMPASEDGFYPEGTEVRLAAVANPRAEFLGWNGAVSGRDPTATVIMDDGQYVEAAFALDGIVLQEGVPAVVALDPDGTR